MTQTLAEARGRRSRRRRRGRIQRWILTGAALFALLTVTAWLGSLAPDLVDRLASSGVRASVHAELQRAHAPADVVGFYAARDDRPLWVETARVWPFWTQQRLRPEAREMAAMAAEPVSGAPAGSDPARVSRLVAAAANGGAQDLARAEVALSLALTDYALRRPPKGAELAFVDPELRTPTDRKTVLAQAADPSALHRRLAALEAGNPIYQALRANLVSYRAEWSRLPQVQVPAGPTLAIGASGERVRLLRVRLGLAAGAGAFDPALADAVRRFQAAHGLPPGGEADAATLAALNAGAGYYERLIEANLQRARALPATASRRFILVNVAARELWLYENGQAKDSMRVIVGQPREPTPMMAGLIRYVVVNPYWNVPVDLVRDGLAPKVLQLGPSYLQGLNMQVLADWGDDAGEMDPQDVDWKAVAAGQVELRVRQRPGGDNMMGTVKFMLPNELGIYLHDTPNKAAFQLPERLLSAGCVRVERADQLKAWLLGHDAPDATWVPPDQRVDLDAPTPVYVTYLTAAPAPSGVSFYPDVYRRDPAMLAAHP